MTKALDAADLERAKEIERQLRVWDADHTPDRWITLLMIHLAAARRESERAGLERAAVFEAALRKIASLDKHSGSSLRTRAASEIAREALRAPEEPT